MNNTSTQEYISKLDSLRFGFPIARFNQWDDCEPAMLCNNLRKDGVKLIISKVLCNNTTLIKSLEKEGFEIMDTMLHYKMEVRPEHSEISFPKQTAYKYREAEASDNSDLKRIARYSFYTGHYFNDKNLDNTQCSEIYPDWIYRATRKLVGDKVFIAHLKNMVVGFATFEIQSPNTLWAGIGATHKDFRNQGICKSILQYGIKDYSKTQLFEYFGSAVSANNKSAAQVFKDLGCKLDEKYYLLHYWL